MAIGSSSQLRFSKYGNRLPEFAHFCHRPAILPGKWLANGDMRFISIMKRLDYQSKMMCPRLNAIPADKLIQMIT